MLKRIAILQLAAIVILALTGCDAKEKRDWKEHIDITLHDGELVRYSSVFILDKVNMTYVVDENDNEELLTYPVYRYNDGTYTIEYADGEHQLYELENPIDLHGTGYTLLKWSFGDDIHYIQDVKH